MKFHFAILAIALNTVSAFALVPICDEASPNLLEKVTAPNPEFEHRGYISPSEMSKLSSREIAERLIKRMHRECDELRGVKEGKSLGEDSDIMMFVPSHALTGVSEYGFQNQHVTRTTNGANTRDGRYSAEIEFPGMILGYSPKSTELLPKYAALDVKRNSNSETMTPWNYGNVVMVMKADVKKRTSWTPSDSLGYQGLQRSKITSSLSFKDTAEPRFKCLGYCEAQVWGQLDISDVEYAMIQPGEEVPKELKDLGMPVFFTEVSENSSVKLKKGLVAHPGDPKLRKTSRTANLTKSENKIVNRIIDQRIIPSMSSVDLMSRYRDSFDLEEKRLLLGQVALIKTPETKKFMREVVSFVSDPMALSQAFLGLSAYGDDPDVRNLFKDFIRSKIPEDTPANAMGMGLGLGGLGFFMSGPVELLTLLAVIADTEGFKDDKDLRSELAKLVEKTPQLKLWYDRLVLNQPLCLPYDPNNKDTNPYGGFGF